MKTIYDLIQLIADETRMAEGKVHKYTFELNLKYGWLSMHEHSEMSTHKNGEWGTEIMYEKDILVMKPIRTESEIQEAYWAVHNNGRSKQQG